LPPDGPVALSSSITTETDFSAVQRDANGFADSLQRVLAEQANVSTTAVTILSIRPASVTTDFEILFPSQHQADTWTVSYNLTNFLGSPPPARRQFQASFGDITALAIVQPKEPLVLKVAVPRSKSPVLKKDQHAEDTASAVAGEYPALPAQWHGSFRLQAQFR
jgi:hypothetical protein